MKNLKLERLTKLPEVTGSVSGEVEIQTQAFAEPSHSICVLQQTGGIYSLRTWSIELNIMVRKCIALFI